MAGTARAKNLSRHQPRRTSTDDGDVQVSAAHIRQFDARCLRGLLDILEGLEECAAEITRGRHVADLREIRRDGVWRPLILGQTTQSRRGRTGDTDEVNIYVLLPWKSLT